MQTVARLTGRVPRIYDRMLGPFLFDWTAQLLAERVDAPSGGRLLELACGTGIATQALRRALPAGVEILATDIHEAMLRGARQWRGGMPGVRFMSMDAHDLPLPDASVDAVACQFGLMFFRDPVRALREARRVVRPGGQLVFSVWGAMAANPAVELVHEVVGSFFPHDRPRFLEAPFALHDVATLRGLFEEAGLHDVGIEVCDHVVELPSAHGPAQGLIRSTRGARAIEARGGSPDVVAFAVESALEARYGRAPFRAPLRAVFVSARRRPAG